MTPLQRYISKTSTFIVSMPVRNTVLRSRGIAHLLVFIVKCIYLFLWKPGQPAKLQLCWHAEENVSLCLKVHSVCSPIPPPLSDICRLRYQLTRAATTNSSGKKELSIWLQKILASASEGQCDWLARIHDWYRLNWRPKFWPTLPPGLRWGDPKCRWSVSPVPIELLGTSSDVLPLGNKALP